MNNRKTTTPGAKGDEMDASTETWADRDGRDVKVTPLREYPETKRTCPRCHGELKVVVGETESGQQVHRLECLICSWASGMLPGPPPPTSGRMLKF